MSLRGRVRGRRPEGKVCLRSRAERTCSGMHNKMVWGTWQWEEIVFLISASVRNPSQHGQKEMLHGFSVSQICVAIGRCSTKIKDQHFPPKPMDSTLLFTLGRAAWWLSQLTVWRWPAEGMRWCWTFQTTGWKEFALQWCWCDRWGVLGTSSQHLDQRHGCSTLKISNWIPEQIPRNSTPFHCGQCCSSCYFTLL